MNDSRHHGLYDRSQARQRDMVWGQAQWVTLIGLRTARRHYSEAKQEN